MNTTMNSIDGIYCLSFNNEKNITLNINKETTFLFETNQKNNKENFYVCIINHLSLNGDNFVSYLAKAKIRVTNKEQRCPVVPIVFRNQNGLIQNHEPWKVLT